MKEIIIYILIIISLKSYSQINKLKPETHKIKLNLTIKQNKNLEILTLRPIDKIKFTFKSGLNYNKNDNKDFELDDFYQMIGYEYRIKYYVNKKLRIVVKDQVIILGQNNYYIGLQLKF